MDGASNSNDSSRAPLLPLRSLHPFIADRLDATNGLAARRLLLCHPVSRDVARARCTFPTADTAAPCRAIRDSLRASTQRPIGRMEGELDQRSTIKVTGPSLTNATFMSARKIPFAIGTPSAATCSQKNS